MRACRIPERILNAGSGVDKPGRCYIYRIMFYETNGNLLLLPLVIILTSLVFMIVIHVIKSLYISTPGRETAFTHYSRILGGIAGGLRGAVIGVFLLVSAHVFFAVFLSGNLLNNYLFKNSFFYSLLRKYDLLPGIGIIETVEGSGNLVNGGVGKQTLRNSNLLKELKDTPSFKAVLEDKNLTDNIRNKNYKAILSSPEFINLLKDKDFMKKMLSVVSDAEHEKANPAEKNSEDN